MLVWASMVRTGLARSRLAVVPVRLASVTFALGHKTLADGLLAELDVRRVLRAASIRVMVRIGTRLTRARVIITVRWRLMTIVFAREVIVVILTINSIGRLPSEVVMELSGRRGLRWVAVIVIAVRWRVLAC